MRAVEVLFTARIGQLTGSTSVPNWTRSVDAMQWPLLNDTGRWGVTGVDLGANTEHSDGRLYIFFGDVAVEQDSALPAFSGNPNNADLIVWTDDRKVLTHGGHLALGWNFFLPSKEQGATDSSGQPHWHLCSKCGGLFWAPDDQSAGICPKGDNHQAIGWNFVLPNSQQGATDSTGQGNWRFCDKCNGLFWAPDGKPNGVCPMDGLPHNPNGWIFYLPNEPIDPDENAHYQPGPLSSKGQPFWRFCPYCKGLFWAGDGFKGVCPGAPGGGFHLHPLLMQDGEHKGKFAPLTAEEPIGITQSLEVTSGAFSHLGRIYLFVNMSEARFSERPRFGDPAYGLYLVMKDRPGVPGVYQKQFLFSPRIGQCPKDETRSLLESHEILGSKFVLPHAPADHVPGPNAWRFCKKCGNMFWDGAFPSVCWKGGAHESDGVVYTLEPGTGEDHQHQSNWRMCQDCSTLVWDGESSGRKGMCPAGGNHRATGDSVRLPYLSITEDDKNQKNWRFCEKCNGLFYWNGDPHAQNCCPRDGGQHVAQGFDFVLPHDSPAGEHDQTEWRFCLKCHGLFWAHDTGGVCPRDHLPHDHGNVGYQFTLRHDVPDDLEHQKDWRFCLNCAGLFWAGGDHGVCPANGLPHDDGNVGFNFVLPHNPGEDELNEGQWRFCTKCFGLVRANQSNVFPGVAPWIVNSADHDLPEKDGLGLVMFTEGHWKGFIEDPGFRLAFMPLKSVDGPRLQDTLYYAGPGPDGEKTWSTNADDAYTLFEHKPSLYTSVSTAWLDGPKCWILLYSKATDADPGAGFDGYKRPALARISRNLTDWSEPFVLFDPAAEGAYGTFMHWPRGSHPVGHPDSEFMGDDMNLNIPPLPVPIDIAHPELGREDRPGWAYGAFILNRFSDWDEPNRTLKIYYLLSTGRPYQVQLMHTWLRIPDEVVRRSRTAYLKLFHGGNGTTPVDSGLPMQGIFYGVAENGNLIWNRYNGRAEPEESAVSVQNWHPNSGNPIGRGFDHMLHVFGCGDGVIMAVHPNGNLYWYSYSGNGESDVTGTLGWHPNSGNVIGNGWQNVRQIFVSPQEGRANTSRLQIFAVAQNGDLYWYSYNGNGEWDPSGTLGWHPNSGNRVGNGWLNARHIHGSSNVFFVVHENGNLLWYSYNGHGEDDLSGTLGWHPNSGNPIGNGWQSVQHVFGGVTDSGGFGHVIMAVNQSGELIWFRYTGQGESDVTGSLGWDPNSGNKIGTNW